MKNWRTTIIGAILAAATAIGVYQSNGGDLADWKLWVIPALVQFLGYLAKDAGITGSVKTLLIGGLLLNLVSCATRSDGAKTFGGLDATQWGGVAVKTGSAYLDTRKQPATVTNAKGVVEVLPEAEKETSWLSMGMSLLGF